MACDSSFTRADKYLIYSKNYRNCALCLQLISFVALEESVLSQKQRVQHLKELHKLVVYVLVSLPWLPENQTLRYEKLPEWNYQRVLW